jgi:G3E family GTPase
VAAAAGGGDSAAAAVLLRDVAYLDTAVTVVDAHQLMANLHSIYTFRVGTASGERG